MGEITLEQFDAEVLRILSVQSDGYLLQPTASSFSSDWGAGEEMMNLLSEPEIVETSLNRLTAAGYAEIYEECALRYATVKLLGPDSKPLIKENGEHIVVPVLGEDDKQVTEPALDEHGNEIVVNHGWVITDLGRKAVDTGGR